MTIVQFESGDTWICGNIRVTLLPVFRVILLEIR